jgi:transaldolase/glucose-6-phosphate isomerase
MNRIREIEKHGQSVWFDFIQRGMIWDGTLHRMVRDDGLGGVTSNPSIFEAAIGKSNDYAPAIASLAKSGATPIEMFEALAIHDIENACDILRPVYDRTAGRDGFVSLEVSPHLAYDTLSTIEEGLRLWARVGRDNLMIKVPATKEGLPAIEELIAEGVNVNVTLLFAVDRYEQVAQRYMAGLERRVARGEAVDRMASVASFFVSRIDTMIDKMIGDRVGSSPPEVKQKLEALLGKVAIANAKLAYRSYERMIGEARWKKLEAAGARTQRLLWASTSTKNPKYRDVVYAEELIGKDTVDTIPEATYRAFADHGEARPTLGANVAEAEATMKRLADVDISMQKVTDKLVEEGVDKFIESFDGLMATVEARRAQDLGHGLSKMNESIGAFAESVKRRLAELQRESFVRRMWDRDPTLWTRDEAQLEMISGSMGWLDGVQHMIETVEHLGELQDDVADSGATHVLLLGMGGSSLAPDVFRRTFGPQPDSPELVVLDSIVPAQLKRAEAAIDPDSTLFVVASKSGTTSEPLALYEHFWKKTGEEGAQFVAITDPDTKLEAMALEREFFAVYGGDPEIGGRYSALSPFGLVPATAMGLDPVDLLARARTMVGSCEESVPPANNLGVRLGAILGELCLAGRDKLTIVASPAIASFGAWLEQLIAESLGKDGKGIVPVDGESLDAPTEYGADRVFAAFSVPGDPVDAAKLAHLEKAGHPVLRFELGDSRDIVQEMFRWEIATATAGHILGVNPFDQPNVEESKRYTKALLDAYVEKGHRPEAQGEVSILDAGPVAVSSTEALKGAFAGKKTLAEVLGAHLAQLRPGDYAAINAYVDMSDENAKALSEIRHAIRRAKKVATTVGFGPRFLHSTGQLHKGGPNTGVFLQITCEDPVDFAVPALGYSFSILKAAQQAGDFMALAKRDRRVLRLHLADVRAGLEAIARALA